MKLSEAFSAPESRVEGTWVFVDMFDSTGMKANGVEANWLPTTGWFYDVVSEKVYEGDAGTIVKFLGDGVMIAYGADGATQAINDAIRIQEALEDGVEGRQVRVACSIGVATGEAVTFETTPGVQDYIGEVVDRASRLCSVASPQAIFVDTATTASAQMNKVRSKLGAVLRRRIAEYQGDEQKTTLKGLATPVSYQEILWSQQPFGLKSKVVTATIDSAAERVTPARKLATLQPHGERGQRGLVDRWDAAKRQGFLVGEDGERFYTDERYLVVEDDDLRADDVVYFVARPSLLEGKARVAAAVVAVQQDVEGEVVKLLDGYGFARVTDTRGNGQDVFFPLGECDGELVRGQRVACTIAEGDRGARAEAVAAVTAAERTAA